MSRETLTKASRISNPGCYATAAQIAIAPLVPYLTGSPTVFGVSGYSGAGTKPSPKNDVSQLKDNLMPYSLTDHIHEREIGTQLGVPVAFVPHVAVWFQGIHDTIIKSLVLSFYGMITQCSQPSGAPVGPGGGTAKTPGRDGTTKCRSSSSLNFQDGRH